MTICFIAFDFVVLSDGKFNSYNLIKISFIIVFSANLLGECLMCLSISLIDLKTSNFLFQNSNRLTTNFLFYYLNSKYFADVVLQSIINLIANFSSIKILLGCFLVNQLVHIYILYGLNDILS